MIYCLGDLMVDVLARLSSPLAVGTDTPAPIAVLGGGSAANTAAWLAAVGVPATFVGRAGDDAFGRAQRDALLAHGLDLALSVDPSLPTGTCIVLVDVDGERTMVPDAGANAALAPADVPVASFTPGDHLHVSGYALFGGAREAALHAMSAARSVGLSISVGAASSGPLLSIGADAFLDWVGTDVLLFANRDEAAVLADAELDVPAADLAAALAAHVGRALVTCGADGAVYCDGSDPLFVPAEAVDVVDSTGAGDTFAAGVLAAFADGAAAEPALEYAHALAAAACTLTGARPAAHPVSAARRRGNLGRYASDT
ncbi:MAG TPA: carbohydrate kinase family protein [Jatrophihabitantaceae bacterium]|nr:carbohydrate kinase family protein [Jatrophihabitantaceae bacterium]